MLADVEVVYFSGDLYPDQMRPFLLALRDIPKLGWMHWEHFPVCPTSRWSTRTSEIC